MATASTTTTSSFGFETTSEEICTKFSSSIKGRTFVVTGPSAKSLGAFTAISLARHSPAQLILVSRSKARVDPVISEINSISPTLPVKFVTCDLSDQDSVRKAAAEIMDDPQITKIDVLINNAGIMGIKPYTTDKKGNELTFSACHIGHFLLTNLIMPKILAAGAGARIVNLTSHGHRIGPMRFADPAFSHGAEYDPWSGYGQAKTANILFSVELAGRLAGRGVRAYGVHPGAIFGTNLAQNIVEDDFKDAINAAIRNTGKSIEIGTPKTLSQGCSSTLVAALDPGLESTPYIADCRPGSPEDYAVDPESARKLWEMSEGLVGQTFEL